MLGVTHFETSQRDETGYYLRWPERGGLKTILEVLFVAALVVVATPVVAGELALVRPSLVPQPFTAVVYGAVWLAFVAVLARLIRSGSVVSTYRFDERAAVDYRIQTGTPEGNWAARHGGLVAVGGALCWATYGRFIATLYEVLDLLVVNVEAVQVPVTPLDGLAVVGFLAGFLLFATGADRLFVDGVRWYIRRRQRAG